jgi:serine protease Do
MRKVVNLSLCLWLMLSVVPIVNAAENPIDILHQISEGQAQIYDRVGPSVVRIITSRTQPEEDESDNPQMIPFMDPKLFEGTPYEFFFQTPDGKKFHQMPDRKRDRDSGESDDKQGHGGFHVNGIGSGILYRVDDSGAWIVTNNHVLGDAERIDIEFKDENPITELNLVSASSDSKRNTYLDKKSDLALVHLSKEVIGERKLTAVPFGDSDALRVGQMVFTLGAPLNRDQTFSQGIISAKDRSGVIPSDPDKEEIRYEGFLQTTAFINVGNSGGPLINVDGQVVGICVAIQTAGGFSNGFVGIGFAIPSNRITEVANDLIAKGKVVRGYLGVGILPPGKADAEYFNLPPKTGALVEKVYNDTPAERGGLKKNDIIMTFNGTPVQSTTHFQEMVAKAPVNQPAKIEVLRGGSKVELSVPVEEQPETTPARLTESGGEFSELGASLRTPNDEETKYYREAGGFEGVIVSEVDPQGPLARRIPKGALITAIEKTKVTSVEQAREILDKILENKSNRREVLVMINFVPNSSENTEEFVIVKLEKPQVKSK